jgi:hypothetical protein
MSQLLSNSFASLQDNDDEELQLEDTSLIATPLSIKTPCTVMSTNRVRAEGNVQEGWEDEDLRDIESDATNESDFKEDVSIDIDHHCKVSLGPRDPPHSNTTFAFENKTTWTPGSGRGGGTILSNKDRLGFLPPIAEGTVLDTEVGVDPSTILRSSKPPPEDITEEQKTFFTF